MKSGIADVPHAEQGGGYEGDHDEDHDSLQVDGVADMRTLEGDGARNTEEGVEGIDSRVKESQFAAFLEEAGLYFIFFHNDCLFMPFP